jgi:hypothetical protein
MPVSIGKKSRRFWGRVWLAVQRVLALILLSLVHYGLTRVLRWVIPPSIEGLEMLGEAIVSVCFVLIYIRLAIEMVVVFWRDHE